MPSSVCSKLLNQYIISNRFILNIFVFGKSLKYDIAP